MIQTPTQKELNAEGITKQYLSSINMSEYSPVQLMPNEEPVNLLKCSKGYWIKDQDGGYLKDEKGQLYVVTEKEALIGRARYILNFQKDIQEQQIQLDIRKLEKKVEDFLNPILEKVKDALCNLGLISDSNQFLRNIIQSQMSEDKQNLVIEQSKKIVEIFPLKDYEQYRQLIDNRKFDELYIMLFQEGLPTIAKFNNTNIEGLKQTFGFDVINETMDDLDGKSHLYKIAYVNIKSKMSCP